MIIHERNRRELFANTIAAWTWSQGTLAASVFALPLLTHFLGTSEFGLWTQLLSLSGLATVADMGMSAVFLRRMTDGTDASQSSILQSATRFYRASSAALTVTLLLVSLVPGGLLSPYMSCTKMPVVTTILTVAAMGVNLRCQPSALQLLSRGRLDLNRIFGSGPAITGTITSIAAAYWFGTAAAVSIGYAAVEIAFDMALVLVARQYGRGSAGPSTHLAFAWWKRVLRESAGVLVINSVPSASLAIGIAVAGHMAGPAAAALYGVASKVGSLVPRSFMPFIESVFVALCRATPATRPAVARLAAQLSVVALASGATVAFIVAAAGPDGMRLVFGTGYGRSVWVVLVLVLTATIRSMYQPFLRNIQSENGIGSLRYWFLASIAVQIPLAIVAAARWSAAGAAIAVLACSALFEAVPTARRLSVCQRPGGVASSAAFGQACAVTAAGCLALLLAWGREQLGTVAIGASLVCAITAGLLTLRQVAQYLAAARNLANPLLMPDPEKQEA